MNAERSGDIPLGYASRGEVSDGPDGALVELGSMVRRPALLPRWRREGRGTSLLSHIAHVVGLRTEEQMRRIDARRIVAVMEDVESGRDGTVDEFVGDTMSTAAALTVPHQEAIASERRGTPPLHGVRPRARFAPRDVSGRSSP